MISIQPISEDNFYKVIKLELNSNQKHYVSPNVQSIAECYLHREANDVFPFAILFEDTVVGFALIYSDDDEKSMTIWRIMIDKNYQGKGYGKQAILELESMIKGYSKYTDIYTSFVQDNVLARALYSSLGYQEIRVNEYNEIVVVKKLD